MWSLHLLTHYGESHQHLCSKADLNLVVDLFGRFLNLPCKCFIENFLNF